MELYERIMSIANKKGMNSAYMLCKKAGISNTVMSDLKTGRSKSLNEKNMLKICEALDCTADEIMGIKKEPSEDSPLSKEKRMLIDIVMKMSDDDIHALLVLLSQKTQ